MANPWGQQRSWQCSTTLAWVHGKHPGRTHGGRTTGGESQVEQELGKQDVAERVLRVGNALDRVQLLWHEIIAVDRHEDTADVQLGADVL